MIGHDQVPDPYHPHRFGGFAHHTDPGRFWNWPLYMGVNRQGHHAKAPPVRRVPTPPPAISGIGIADGATVSGVVAVAPAVSGGPVAKAELWVDGAVVARAGAAPWSFRWDTSSLAPGVHTVAVRLVGPHGQAAASVAAVTVAAPPAP